MQTEAPAIVLLCCVLWPKILSEEETSWQRFQSYSLWIKQSKKWCSSYCGCEYPRKWKRGLSGFSFHSVQLVLWEQWLPSRRPSNLVQHIGQRSSPGGPQSGSRLSPVFQRNKTKLNYCVKTYELSKFSIVYRTSAASVADPLLWLCPVTHISCPVTHNWFNWRKRIRPEKPGTELNTRSVYGHFYIRCSTQWRFLQDHEAILKKNRTK